METRHPHELTRAELAAYQVPSPHAPPVRSLDPGQPLPDGARPLFTTPVSRHFLEAADEARLRTALGADTPYWDAAQFHNARQGQPVKIYRATDAERVIWPGAWVTMSKAVAEDHRDHALGGRGHVLTQFARPHDLHVLPDWPHPQEFIYAPADRERWHRGVVLKALQDGERVPEAVLNDLTGDQPADARKLLGLHPLYNDGNLPDPQTLLTEWQAQPHVGPIGAQIRLAALEALRPHLSPTLFAKLCQQSGVPQARALVERRAE